MIQFQVHAKTSYSTAQVFICHNSQDRTTRTIIAQDADMELVQAMREAADKIETELINDAREQAIRDRIKAEMEGAA